MITQPPVIELRGIGRRFGTDPPLDALAGVDLAVQRGDWLAIAGPSGSGKSTLLNIIGLLDMQTSGSYRFNGIDVAGLRALRRDFDIGTEVLDGRIVAGGLARQRGDGRQFLSEIEISELGVLKFYGSSRNQLIDRTRANG